MTSPNTISPRRDDADEFVVVAYGIDGTDRWSIAGKLTDDPAEVLGAILGCAADAQPRKPDAWLRKRSTC